MMNTTSSPEKGLTGYPSIDKPWLNYYKEGVNNVSLPECTVYENIYQHNKNYFNETAMEYFGKKISYKKLFETVELCARALKENGISGGDIINICSSVTPEITYLILACSKIGALANLIDPLSETQQKINDINAMDSDTLFVMDKMYHYVKDVIAKTCLKKIVVIPATNSLSMTVRVLSALKDKVNKEECGKGSFKKYVSWKSYIKSGNRSNNCISVEYKKGIPMCIVHSSGSTGASKGIVLTNDGINSTILQYETGLFSEKKHRFLCNIPCWFATSIVLSLLMPLCLGTNCILEPLYSPERFLYDIVRYKPNYAIVPTGVWLYALNRINKKFDLSFLKCPITGGEQMLGSSERFINDILRNHNCTSKIEKGWGMSELGTTAATSVFSEYNKLESVGIPMPFAVISAFDVDSNKELPYNGRGELRVCTPCQMKEYYNNPVATEEFFWKDAGGNVWGRTGDIGYVDKDGFVFVLGRANDFFLLPDGKRHYLFDTENVILENDFVDLCEVVTVKSEKWDKDVLTAHLVLKKDFDGDINALIFEIDKVCRERLPEYAVPVGYKIRECFAIKSSGKRDTLSLKEERSGFMTISDGRVKQKVIE